MKNKNLNIDLINIPLINLRIECRRIYDFWLSSELDKILTERNPISLNTGSMIIVAEPYELITATLQRCLLGLETYVQSAAQSAYISRHPNGCYSWNTFPRVHEITEEKRLAAKLYKSIPKLVDENLSLAYMDNGLYQWLLHFYKNIRNPIFHGMQIQKVNGDDLRSIAMEVAKVYRWIDSWYEPHQAFQPVRLNPAIFLFPNPDT